VEGPDSRTKAKGGTGTTRDIKDIPSGETRARPEILGKHLVHSDNHGIGVSDPRVHEGPVVVGQDMKRDWSVKPSLAPRKVEGLSSIAMARHVTGKGMADRAKPRRSMEHHQSGVRVSGPRSWPEDLERHRVHSDNQGSSVSDPPVSPENNADEEEDPDRGKARQRNEEKVRQMNQGDIEVLGAGPVVVGQDMRRGWSVKPSLAPRKVEGLGSIAKARHGTGKGMAFGAKNLVIAWNTSRGSV
jgi:hypothetical protein